MDLADIWGRQGIDLHDRLVHELAPDNGFDSWLYKEIQTTFFPDPSNIAGPGELSIPFLLDENPKCSRSAWAARRSDGR
jgi:hypothetical protein